MMNGFLKTDGRWIVGACIAAYFLFLGMLTGPLHGGRVTVFQALGVPAVSPAFSDALCVAHWCDGYGRGEDPGSLLFKDPDGNVIPMNYPRVFLGFHYLGLSSSTIVVWGGILGVIFFMAGFALCQGCTRGEAIIWSLALLSPSVVMGVERGNFDCLVFGLLVVSSLLVSRPALSGILVLVASALKIYPAAALAALVIRRRPAIKAFAIASVAIVILASYLMVSSVHPIGGLNGISCFFGSKVIMMILSSHLGFMPAWMGMASQSFALLLMIVGICWGYLRIPETTIASLGDREMNVFWTGVPVYLLVFLSGDQADYKMIFGLFALPALMAWMRLGSSDRWIPKTWILLFLLYSYWLFFSDEGSLRNMLLRQIMAWMLFVMTSVAAGALMPVVLRVRRAVGNRT